MILLGLVLCATILAADPIGTEPVTVNHSSLTPKAAKSKRTFAPFRLLRRLAKAESEFGLRLSSRGIQQEVEDGRSQSLPQPSPSTEASMSMPQRLGGGSQ
jgi:hypothetical protein